MRNERYYYSIMQDMEREAYRLIYDGIKAYALNIIISLPLSPKQVQNVYRKVLFDNPLFYYINQTIIKMLIGPDEYLLMPQYIYRINEIEAINRDIRAIVNKVGNAAQKYENNEFLLEKYIHDSVVKSITYDHDALEDDECTTAYSIVGAFIERKAVCEGISKAFKLLCNEHSIKCIVVLGKASNDGNYDDDSNHAWNLVKIGGESYHVDATWDNMYHDGLEHISYDYFNVTTDEILKDHIPEDKLPICTATKYNYFNCTNSYVRTYEELVRLIRERLHLKFIVFKILNDRGEFDSAAQIKQKIEMALTRVFGREHKAGNVAVTINERHSIVKIIILK